MSYMANDATITFRLPKPLVERVDLLASYCGLTRSGFVLAAVHLADAIATHAVAAGDETAEGAHARELTEHEIDELVRRFQLRPPVSDGDILRTKIAPDQP